MKTSMQIRENRAGFISVGAVGQQVTSLLMLGACSVLRILGEAAGRLDSSLRGHRSRRSQCRPACSGPNKTMSASVGPNSRCRSHRLTFPAWPWRLRGVSPAANSQPSRMNPYRGHRLDVVHPTSGCTKKLPPHEQFVPPLISHGMSWSGWLKSTNSSLCLGLVGRLGSVPALAALVRLLVADHRVERAARIDVSTYAL